MVVLFWIFWIIDFLMMLICFYETYVVSSNSSLAIPAVILLAIVSISFYFRDTQVKVAMWIALIPVILLLLWFIFIIFKSDWR